MFKGKSTIELFDGITGKKKEEYKDENSVTDALRNMLDLGSGLLTSGAPLNLIIERLTPLYPTYLRGILLWDDFISESAGYILPPPGINCVGHAGNSYSGNNILRGTLNENETEVGGNRVKIVWDFATDKANGVIKSISLTSVLGGDRGWMTPWEQGTHLRSSIQTPGTQSLLISISPSQLLSGNTAAYFYAGELRDGVHSYVADRNDNALTIAEQSFVSPDSIGIFDNAGVMTHNAPHCRETINTVMSNARFANMGTNHLINENNNFVHVLLSGTGNRTARIRIVNLAAKSIIEDRTITLDTDVNATPAAFFKGEIYASITGRGICRFDEAGRFVKVCANILPASKYTCFGGGYLVSSFVSSSMIFMTDGVNEIVQGGFGSSNTMNLYNATSIKPPLFVLYNEQVSSGTKSINYVTPYMATINNLKAPVTKNNQNTMKVTYELTHD